MEVQTCMRGFSFMPKKSMEIIDLKYVEKDALEQTWKTTKRLRLKQQEQRIWDQFVQEQDIVSSVCEDDPYQFLHQLPESCIKDLLQEELQKMRNEETVETVQEQEAEMEPAPAKEIDNQHVVTFVEEENRENVFHIFDDEKDEEISAPEDGNLNESISSPPCTVRERYSERDNKSPTKSISPDKASSKSSENVTNIIESSIYCAKVKDLRIKINEELQDIIATLERQDLTKIEPEEVSRLLKRSTEFCARFNRIYLYQLHRQVHEVQRGASAAAALPFARHTQFQSQMVRIVSLHQSLLQTAQIFHKSIPQTACIRDSGEVLRTLLRTVREASAASRDTAPPGGLTAAQYLYTDNIHETCDKLEDGLTTYTQKLSEYLDNFEHTGKSKKGKSNGKGKKASLPTWSKSGTKSGTDTEGRLSMYSLDTQRHNLISKSSISKGHSSGTSKVRGGLSTRRKQEDRDDPPRSPKKSPKNRRPLMRDPAAGKPRRKLNRELDVPTLVEAVTACASSHISREETPHQTPRDSNTATPRRSKDTKKEPSKKPHNHAPQKKSKSPKSAKKYNCPEKHADETTDDVKPEKINDGKVEKNGEGQKPKGDELKVELKPKSPKRIIESTVRAAKDQVDSARTQKQDTHVESKRSHDTPKIKCESGAEVKVSCQENVSKVDREIATPRCKQDGNNDGRQSDRDRKVMEVPGSCEVSRLLRQLCGGDTSGNKNEKVSGAKNAQLLCVNSSGSPRQPSTPQLLRILEETIQKKTPKPLCPKPMSSARDAEKLRLTFNIPDKTTENFFQYRTKFVQHMLTSSMYANSAVGKPWEMIGRRMVGNQASRNPWKKLDDPMNFNTRYQRRSLDCCLAGCTTSSISDKIIDELLLGCAKEMELRDIVQELYTSETR